MGFQKNNMRIRFEKIAFFWIGEFLRQLHLKLYINNLYILRLISHKSLKLLT
jgi:hypothetical protein